MRFVSIDLLRTIAIVLMVIVHFMENLAGAKWVAAGLGAPLFTFLVGVSYHLWFRAQEAKGFSDREITWRTIRRGVFLLVLGFAFNVLVWLPDDIFNWDVLTLIGTAMLVLAAVRHLPLVVIASFCFAAFALALMLRAMTDYHAYWVEGYFELDFTVSDVIIGYFANGYFPLFPWIIYPLTGFVTATLIVREPGEPEPSTNRPLLCALSLLTLALLARVLRPLVPEDLSRHVFTGWTMFPPSVEYVLGTLGLALLLFTLAHRWIDRNPRLAQLRRAGILFQTFSKFSLTIYLLHHVVHLWPLWLYGLAMGEEPTHYWRQAMPVNLAVGLAILYLVGCFLLCRWMERTGRRGIEGWMRDLCDRRASEKV